jgi:hypothetical protein
MSAENLTKTCSKCLVEKPISEFYFRKDRNKFREECKICWKIKVRLYNQSEYGKKIRCEWSKKARKFGGEKEINLRAVEKYYKNNRDKIRASSGIRERVKRGRMPHPKTLKCNHCFQQASLYHHHLGYSKEHQWDVIPLCKSCHINIHYPPLII